MPGLHKGVSTHHTTQQQFAKPRHQPSERDKQARDRLRNKAKIKSCAYIQLGETALQTVHQTFKSNIPVILHLPALINTTTDTDTVPMLFIIQEGINCMPTTYYFSTRIKPEHIIVSQQAHPLWPGETRVYPSMLADKQVPVLNLTKSTITSQADLQAAFESIHLCFTKEDELLHGAEESKEDKDTE